MIVMPTAPHALLKDRRRPAAGNLHRLAWSGALALIGLAAGCGPLANPSTAARGRKFYWVQPLKGHPVHQMTQIAFREGCRDRGYECEVLGTEGIDLPGTIDLAEQALARGDAAGMAIWAGNPAFNLFIKRAGKAGVPIILPHFPVPQGSIPGATGVISCDPAAYAHEAAVAIGRAVHGMGTVAITQGAFNSTENLVSETFRTTMAQAYPRVKVLDPEEEGFDLPRAVAKATAILQAHPDVVAALSTTGGGPTTWANAQKETGRTIVVIGMDYTRVNLGLVKAGRVYAVIGQPLWDEAYGAAGLLDKAVHGVPIPWWTKLPAPLITRDQVAPYAALLDRVEAAIHQ